MTKIPTAITGRLGKKNRNKLALRKSEDKRREVLSMVLSSMKGFNPGVEAKVEEVQQTPEVGESSQEKTEVEQSQEPQDQEGVVAQTKDWASLSKSELMEEAKSAGLKVKVTASKTELVELLTQNG